MSTLEQPSIVADNLLSEENLSRWLQQVDNKEASQRDTRNREECEARRKARRDKRLEGSRLEVSSARSQGHSSRNSSSSTAPSLATSGHTISTHVSDPRSKSFRRAQYRLPSPCWTEDQGPPGLLDSAASIENEIDLENYPQLEPHLLYRRSRPPGIKALIVQDPSPTRSIRGISPSPSRDALAINPSRPQRRKNGSERRPVIVCQPNPPTEPRPSVTSRRLPFRPSKCVPQKHTVSPCAEPVQGKDANRGSYASISKPVIREPPTSDAPSSSPLSSRSTSASLNLSTNETLSPFGSVEGDSDSGTSSNNSSSSSSNASTSSSESDIFSIARKKKLLLERLMSYFFLELFPQLSSPASVQRPSGGGGGGGGTRQAFDDANPSGSYPSLPSSTQKQKGKRLPEEDNDQNSGDGGGHKKVRLDPPDDPETTRLGCPYFKNNPQRYRTWQSCPGPGWSTVYRLKEHLYRRHALPITCPRCHEIFDTATLRDGHLVADERCHIRDKPDFDGFDASQLKLLRSRKKGTKHLSEADKWRDVYLILFPGTSASEIPSPYLDFGGSGDTAEAESAFARYEQYLRRELPKKVRRELEARIDQALEPLEESLKSQIVEIVRDAQASLYENFLSASSGTSENERACEPFCETMSSAAGGQPGLCNGTFVFDDQLESCEPVPLLGGDVGDIGDFNSPLFGVSSEISHFVGSIWPGDSSVVGQYEPSKERPPRTLDDGDSGYGSILYPAQLDLYDAFLAPAEDT